MRKLTTTQKITLLGIIAPLLLGLATLFISKNGESYKNSNIVKVEGVNNAPIQQTIITEPATLPKLYLSSNVILDDGTHELVLIVANSSGLENLTLNHPEYCKFVKTFYVNLQPNPNSHGEPAKHVVFYCTSPADLENFSLRKNE